MKDGATVTSLYTRRRAAGIRQGEMAKRLGVSHQTLYAWEHGRCIPRADKIAPLARELGCSEEELIKEYSTPKEEIKP